LSETAEILIRSIKAVFEDQRNVLEGFRSSLGFYSPIRMVQTERQRVDEMNRRGYSAQAHRLELASTRVIGLENRLLALSPLGVLQRGYAVVTKNKRVVASKSQVRDGDGLQVRVRDGEFDARVTGDG
jgi:exodeoxyribonuclease VII large subunit